MKNKLQTALVFTTLVAIASCSGPKQEIPDTQNVSSGSLDISKDTISQWEIGTGSLDPNITSDMLPPPDDKNFSSWAQNSSGKVLPPPSASGAISSGKKTPPPMKKTVSASSVVTSSGQSLQNETVSPEEAIAETPSSNSLESSSERKRPRDYDGTSKAS